jgi:hypothetical protein
MQGYFWTCLAAKSFADASPGQRCQVGAGPAAPFSALVLLAFALQLVVLLRAASATEGSSPRGVWTKYTFARFAHDNPLPGVKWVRAKCALFIALCFVFEMLMHRRFSSGGGTCAPFLDPNFLTRYSQHPARYGP